MPLGKFSKKATYQPTNIAPYSVTFNAPFSFDATKAFGKADVYITGKGSDGSYVPSYPYSVYVPGNYETVYNPSYYAAGYSYSGMNYVYTAGYSYSGMNYVYTAGTTTISGYNYNSPTGGNFNYSYYAPTGGVIYVPPQMNPPVISGYYYQPGQDFYSYNVGTFYNINYYPPTYNPAYTYYTPIVPGNSYLTGSNPYIGGNKANANYTTNNPTTNPGNPYTITNNPTTNPGNPYSGYVPSYYAPGNYWYSYNNSWSYTAYNTAYSNSGSPTVFGSFSTMSGGYGATAATLPPTLITGIYSFGAQIIAGTIPSGGYVTITVKVKGT